MGVALLLIDIQNDYFPGGANELVGAEMAADNAARVLQYFRENDLPVIHIQHLATRPDATFFLPGTKGADIHQSVYPLETEKLIVKHFPNSFRETELLQYLRANYISELVVAGMMTHMCVDATVRAAKDYGYVLTVLSDACATKNLQIAEETVNAKEVHNSFLAALGYYYAAVMSTQQYFQSK